jgi:flagellar hook-associated protein 1 FlgK
MASSFLGLGTAYSGLTANQRALQVTSHNIANANTEGYSRQRLDMFAEKPDTLPAGFGTLGMGVTFGSVKQIRDEFLDYKYRQENSKMAEWESREEVLKIIESVINEPSDSGMREIMDQFFAATQELSKNPENLTTRTLVRQRGIALTSGLNNISEGLKQLQRDMNFEFESAVRELNGYASQIAKLNDIIYATEVSGGKANDIRDQRNVLVDKMSALVDIDYYEDAKGRFHVLLNGNAIVAHTRHDTLEIKERDDVLNYDDPNFLVDIQWASGVPFDATSGKIKGIMDMRDNIAGDSKGIPYYVDKINEFTDALMRDMNQVHYNGFGLQGETNEYFFTIKGMNSQEFEDHLLTKGFDNGPALDVTDSVLQGTTDLEDPELREKIHANIEKLVENNPQYAFKSVQYIGGSYYMVDKLRASDITVNPDFEDLNLIAAASSQDGAPGDGSNALKLANVRHDNSLFQWGSADDFIKSLVSNLGVDTQEAVRVRENQEVLIEAAQYRRESVSGVSLDEEMSNMVRYQHAYNANARMVNVVDEMLDLLVNRLGTVGR